MYYYKNFPHEFVPQGEVCKLCGETSDGNLIMHNARERFEESMGDVVAQSLGDLSYCSRDWSAWSYGTMTEDDFGLAGEDPEIVGDILNRLFPMVKDAEVLKIAPAGVTVLDNGGDVMTSVWNGEDAMVWMIAGDNSEYDYRDIELPVRVLYNPEIGKWNS